MQSQTYQENENFWHERIFRSDLVLQSIAEGICVIDKKENIVFANASAVKNLGFTVAPEIIG